MYSEQLAMLLLVAATHVAQPGAMPREAATAMPARDDALKLRVERGFTDSATRQAQRKRAQAAHLEAPTTPRLRIAGQIGE